MVETNELLQRKMMRTESRALRARVPALSVRLEDAALEAFKPNRTLTRFCEHAGEWTWA
jgi:hypothetical protein